MTSSDGPRREYSFDTQCLFLAKHFLQDGKHTNAEAFELAQDIQDAVEAWFERTNGEASSDETEALREAKHP